MILPNAHAIPPKPHSHRHDQMTLPQVVGFIATAQKLQGLHRRQRRPAVALGQDVDAPPGVNGTGTFPWIRREVFGQVKPTWEPLKNCRNDQNTRDSYGFIACDAEIYMVIWWNLDEFRTSLILQESRVTTQKYRNSKLSLEPMLGTWGIPWAGCILLVSIVPEKCWKPSSHTIFFLEAWRNKHFSILFICWPLGSSIIPFLNWKWCSKPPSNLQVWKASEWHSPQATLSSGKYM